MFGNFLLKALNKEIDWDTDTIKVMLTTSTYVPDQDAHIYKSSVTNEITGTGYSTTGVSLTGVSITYTGGSNLIALDAADASWSGASFTARIAVIYDSSPGSDATRPLCGYVDFGADQTVSSGTFTIQWDSSGIFTITVS